MSWRDFVPGVDSTQGKIRLSGDDEEASTVEEKEAEQKECPRLRANIFQVLTFSWLTPMCALSLEAGQCITCVLLMLRRCYDMNRMKAGKNAYLNEEDLWSLPPDDTAEALGTRLEHHWQKRRDAVKGKPGKQASLTGALAGAFGGPFFYAAIFKVSRYRFFGEL